MPTYIKRPPPEPTFQAVQFNGSNRADVIALGAQADSNPDGTLTLATEAHPRGERIVQPGDWIVAVSPTSFVAMDDEDFQAAYALQTTKSS